MKFQYREHQKFISTTPMVGKSSRRPTHSSSNINMFCNPYINQNNQERVVQKLLTASPRRKQLRECQEKKSFSLSKKQAICRIYGTKRKRSSKKDKIGVQKSYSESDTEIEFRNDNSGDDISDRDAECSFCTGFLSHDKHGEEWTQCVRCYRWAREDCGVEEDYFVYPMCRKSVKLYVTSRNTYFLVLGH